jgi:hypothetical protein
MAAGRRGETFSVKKKVQVKSKKKKKEEGQVKSNLRLKKK